MISLSIVTAVRNAEGTIGSCLESISSQTYPVEHIIIDGASTDGTLQVIKGYSDANRRVISEPDKGMYDAVNKGIRFSSGEVVGMLNADDLYTGPLVLELVARAFLDTEVDCCYGDLVYVHPVRIQSVIRYWHAGPYRQDRFWWGWMPPHPTFFVRRRAYEKYGLYNSELGSAADYELMLRFLVRFHLKAVYLPEILVRMRTGGMSNSLLRNRIKANRMDRLAWKINGLRPYPWTLWAKPIRKIPQYLGRAGNNR
jgi:glycosyltransferase involved in cell wall biosynthesis